MPITKTQGYKASDGVVYATLDEARWSEVANLLKPVLERCNYGGDSSPAVFGDRLAKELLAQGDALLAILTTGPRSRPSTRKRAGTTNPKRAVAKSARTPLDQAFASVRATPAQAEAGFAGMRAAVEAPAAVDSAA